MGQWSHRRRRGGGASPLNFIIDARIISPTFSQATYLYPVDANSFDPNTFSSEPSHSQVDVLDQLDTRTIEFQWLDNIAADATLFYFGATPGIVTPQTISYS